MNRGFVVPVAAVFAVAILLRVYFGFTVHVRHSNKSFSLIHRDAIEYIHLGENLYRSGRYADPTSVQSRYRAVLRPPGYPVFYWMLCELGLDLTNHLSRVIWPQVALSLAMPAATMWFLYAMSRRRWLAILGGMASALSPTGIAIPALATADTMFAALFSVGVCLLMSVIRYPRGASSRSRAALAGFLFACALLVKPVLLLWPALLILVLIGRIGFHRRTGVLGCAAVLPIAVVWAGWTARNYDWEKLPTFSAISTRNLLYYVTSKVELTAQLGREPTPTEFKAWFAQTSLAQETYIFANPDATVAGLLRSQQQRVRSVLREHPWITLQVLARNIANQNSNRWKAIHRQIPGDDEVGVNIRKAYDHTDETAVVVAEIAGLALACVALFNRASSSRLRWQLALLFAAWLSVVLPLATVSDEGSRLTYPSEPMRLALWLFGVYWIWTAWRKSGQDAVGGEKRGFNVAVSS